jgi:hypothetical protein
MRPSLFKRLSRSFGREFRRIVDDNRKTKAKIRRPAFSKRVRLWFERLIIGLQKKRKQRPFTVNNLKRWWSNFHPFEDVKLTKTSLSEQQSLKNRLRFFLYSVLEVLKIVFSRDYLIIAANSSILFLLSFFLVNFIMQLVTGVSAFFVDIGTLISFHVIDYRIHAFDWSLLQVIVVFSAPTLLSLILIFVLSRFFERKKKKIKWFRWPRQFTKKGRQKQRELAYQKKKEKGIQRQQKIQLMYQAKDENGVVAYETVSTSRKWYRRFNWVVKLFLLWTMYHLINFFFSGMLFSYFFYRRFGYVIWYIFNSSGFNLFFLSISAIFMVVLGFVFAPQFLYSGKMYFNDLTDRIRLPFVISQVVIPFFIGSILTFVAEIPRLSLTMTLMNISIGILLIAVPIRGVYFAELHFDSKPKNKKFIWKWLVVSVLLITGILILLKAGIEIKI